MQLETSRFVLRDFTKSDRDAFLAYHEDARFRAVHGTAAVDVVRLLDTFEVWRRDRPRRNFQLAIAEKASGAMIGCAGLRQDEDDRSVAALGIELAPRCWGRYRYALEIVEALLAFGFSELGLGSIYGRTTAGNRPAARLARWGGARCHAIGGEIVEWRLMRADWAARSRR